MMWLLKHINLIHNIFILYDAELMVCLISGFMMWLLKHMNLMHNIVILYDAELMVLNFRFHDVVVEAHELNT